MKTFSAIFSITLLLTCPFIYSMDTHQKIMCLQQQEQHSTCTYMLDCPAYRADSQPNTYYINHKMRRNITKKMRDANNLEDTTDKIAALTTLQTKLLYLKTIAPEQNQQWLDQQLQEIEQHINACHYSEPKIESADSENMSQTMLLEQAFITRAQKIAQEETQLNQIKREAEEYKTAYKERLLQKQESLIQNAESATQKEQELRAELLKIQQALSTTQLQKQELEQLLHTVQSRITVIENYTPHQNQNVDAKSISTATMPESSAGTHYCDEPTDDLQIERPQRELPEISLIYNNQTSKNKNSQLSHSCNMQ